jgi:GAF domain-containing protein
MDVPEPAHLAEVFVEIADTLVADFDLVEFLGRLTTRLTELLPAEEVGIILADPGEGLRLIASSSERMHVLELYEVQHLEGPCLDCHATGAAVVNVDLADADSRWPRFAPLARRGGFRVVHALPMRHGDQGIGVVNIFDTTGKHLTTEELRVSQALADIATIGILHEEAIQEGRKLSEQLQHALDSRVVVEQAKAVLYERHSLDMGAAYEQLRGYARRSNLKVADVARRLLAGELPSEDVISSPSGRGEHSWPRRSHRPSRARE